jgi:transcription antitermination factor NusA-like protein
MVEHVFPDEENNSVFVLVPEDQKPLAIGMGGRNVRLASEIVGWGIDLKTPTEYEQELLAEGNIEDLPEVDPPEEGNAEEGSTEEGIPEEA